MSALSAAAPPPDTALRPRDEADIVDILKGRTAPLTIAGHGSKHGLGRPDAHQRLSVRDLAGIIDYEPAELVLTARAATPLAEIKALLAEHRQHLAFEPPDWGPLYGGSATAGTLGGIIACNLAGSRRVTVGAARDHFLGFRAVNGRGEAFKAGGKVVKNVTGYDLPKLLAGSFGTLAVLTEVTVKVLPAPESRITLRFAGLDDAAAIRCLTQALGSRHEVGAGAHVPAGDGPAGDGPAGDGPAGDGPAGDGPAATLIRIEGPAPSTQVRARMLTDELQAYGKAEPLETEEADALWQGLGNAAPFARDAAALVWRVSVPPAEGAAFVAALPEAPAVHWYDWGGGLVWLSQPSGADPQSVRAAARTAGGHAMLVRADADLSQRAGLFGPLEPGLAALTRRVKASFDPGGLLGRGRISEHY